MLRPRGPSIPAVIPLATVAFSRTPGSQKWSGEWRTPAA
jgi:hypothetical protein